MGEKSRNIPAEENDPTVPVFEVNKDQINKKGETVKAVIGTKFGYFSLTGKDEKPEKGKMTAKVPTQEDMRKLYETQEYAQFVKLVFRPNGYKAHWESL
jgi:hypothetical protein